MAPRILATGSNIDFVNSVIKILPEDSAPVYCPAVYTSLKEAASSMTVDYLLLCLDQERDNTSAPTAAFCAKSSWRALRSSSSERGRPAVCFPRSPFS